jgi:hypothetical protein
MSLGTTFVFIIGISFFYSNLFSFYLFLFFYNNGSELRDKSNLSSDDVAIEDEE